MTAASRWALVATLLASIAPAAAAEDQKVIAELRLKTQELLDAVAPGQVEVWRKHLDERAIHVDENGKVRTKSELLAELTPLPPGLVGRLEIAAYHAQVHGDVAVATHEDRERLDYHGQILDSRFRTTDTWRKSRDGWKLIATQVLAVPVDPPPARLPREALCTYDGTYALTAAIRTEIRCGDDGIVAMRTGRPPVTWRAELLDVFFAPGQPRTRRIFERDGKGAISGFVDRREGHDIQWKKIAP